MHFQPNSKNVWSTESESHYCKGNQLSPSYTNRKWVVVITLSSRFISSHWLINRMSVILLKVLASSLADLILSLLVNTVCKWHSFLASYNLSSYYQLVSYMNHFPTWLLQSITSANNRKWVGMHFVLFCNFHPWIQKVGGALSPKSVQP